MRIPYGTTISYSQLAQNIGNKTAVRAVANAVAANKLAVIIPCHRIIGKGGNLTGYKWGIEKKKWLLEHERIS
jgi:O-6-methylguanine DNA methyltransferase